MTFSFCFLQCAGGALISTFIYKYPAECNRNLYDGHEMCSFTSQAGIYDTLFTARLQQLQFNLSTLSIKHHTHTPEETDGLVTT